MTRIRTLGAVGLAAIMLLAMAAGPAMAAAPTVDTETTDTSTQSDVTDGSNVTGFEASSDNNTYLEASFDSTNASIEIVDPDSGVVHASNDSDAMTQTAAVDSDSDGTNDTWYYAWNVSHDELATMPMDAGENKSITVRFINDTSLDNPDTTEITIYLENVEDRAVVYAGSEAAAGNVSGVEVTSETDEPFIGLFSSAEDSTTVEADSVDLGNNTSSTTVTVIAADTGGADVFGQAEASKLVGSYGAGDYMSSHALVIDGEQHAVFSGAGEAPTDELATDVTYAETTTVDGEDAYQITVGDEHSGAVDIETRANDGYGAYESFQVRRTTYGSTTGALFG